MADSMRSFADANVTQSASHHPRVRTPLDPPLRVWGASCESLKSSINCNNTEHKKSRKSRD
jgi:hypothetical protein